VAPERQQTLDAYPRDIEARQHSRWRALFGRRALGAPWHQDAVTSEAVHTGKSQIDAKRSKPDLGRRAMPLLDGRAVAAVMVGFVAILALAVAADAYVQRSYDAAFEEFLAANTPSDAVKPDVESKLGCPVGKKELPTQLGGAARGD